MVVSIFQVGNIADQAKTHISMFRIMNQKRRGLRNGYANMTWLGFMANVGQFELA